MLIEQKKTGFNHYETYPFIPDLNKALNPFSLEPYNLPGGMSLPRLELSQPQPYRFGKGKPDSVYLKYGDGIIQARLRNEERESRRENAYGLLASNIPKDNRISNNVNAFFRLPPPIAKSTNPPVPITIETQTNESPLVSALSSPISPGTAEKITELYDIINDPNKTVEELENFRKNLPKGFSTKNKSEYQKLSREINKKKPT